MYHRIILKLSGEALSGEAGFWDDLENSQKVLQQIKGLKNKVDGYEKLEGKYEDILTLCEMGNEEEDESLIPEARQLSKEFTDDYEKLKISTLLEDYSYTESIMSFGEYFNDKLQEED